MGPTPSLAGPTITLGFLPQLLGTDFLSFTEAATCCAKSFKRLKRLEAIARIPALIPPPSTAEP